MARVINPLPVVSNVALLGAAATRRSNPASETEELDQLYEEFRGKPSEYVDDLEVPPGTPERLAHLGGLIDIELEGETIEFEPSINILCADADGNLHIAGPPHRDPELSDDEGRLLLGEIAALSYSADKVHIFPDEEPYRHEFGEDVEGAQRPELYYEDGFYFIEGGDYAITSDGIVDTEPGVIRNGAFTDLMRYTAGRMDKRKARKRSERAAVKAARLRARS